MTDAILEEKEGSAVELEHKGDCPLHQLWLAFMMARRCMYDVWGSEAAVASRGTLSIPLRRVVGGVLGFSAGGLVAVTSGVEVSMVLVEGPDCKGEGACC
jgi:hypothetical protein